MLVRHGLQQKPTFREGSSSMLFEGRKETQRTGGLKVSTHAQMLQTCATMALVQPSTIRFPVQTKPRHVRSSDPKMNTLKNLIHALLSETPQGLRRKRKSTESLGRASAVGGSNNPSPPTSARVWIQRSRFPGSTSSLCPKGVRTR